MGLRNRKTGEVTYAGRVVSDDGSRERRLMSDVYADVWYATVVADDGSRESVSVSSNFECWSDHYEVTVDLSDEWALYAETASVYFAALSSEEDSAAALKELAVALKAAEKAAKRKAKKVYVAPEMGDTVTVTRGTAKTPKGSTGKVVWLGTSRYDENKVRLGFETAAGDKLWTNAVSAKVEASAERVAALTVAANEKAAAKVADLAARLASREADLAAARESMVSLSADYVAARELAELAPATHEWAVGDVVMVIDGGRGSGDARVTRLNPDGSYAATRLDEDWRRPYWSRATNLIAPRYHDAKGRALKEEAA